MKLHFEKYSAHGNDFIIIDNRLHTVDNNDSGLFRRLCRRRTAVGADGVILLDTDKPDYRAHFFNADGLPASMCGNGSRAAADCARRLGIISTKGIFWVGNVRHHAEIEQDGGVGIDIFIDNDEPVAYEFSGESGNHTGFFCTAGVPHLIIFDDRLAEEKPVEYARKIRSSRLFAPAGANVSFVRVVDPNTIEIATFERGVEDFTLSCGTGAAAAVFSGIRKAGLKLPVSVRAQGGTLRVTGKGDSRAYWIWGTVARVYSGIIDGAA